VLVQPALVVALEIAGAACRLHCDDEPFAALLAARYADFSTAAEPTITIDVTVTGPVTADVVAAWSGPYARVRSAGPSIAVEGVGFTAEYDETTARGWITQPPDPEPLETLLTAVHASRLLAAGGCMIHAATIVGRAGACVFFGPSGSGKTTVTELVGDGVVTDEITAIRPAGDGYVVSSVPWRGIRRTAPLAALFRLTQADRTSVTPLAPLDLVRHLLGSVFLCRRDAPEIGRFFEAAAALARAAPAYDLEFTRDRGFWNALEGGAVA
jgi:hypothetical protein